MTKVFTNVGHSDTDHTCVVSVQESTQGSLGGSVRRGNSQDKEAYRCDEEDEIRCHLVLFLSSNQTLVLERQSQAWHIP